MTFDLSSKSVKSFNGELNIPGDKSISHRALIIGSQAIGETKITGLLESDDVLNTMKSLQKLGVEIVKKGKSYKVYGGGIGSLREASDILDFGNSGTGCRLMMGLLATYNFTTYFTGDDSLKSRPMDRIFNPIKEFNAEINARSGKYLPASITGGCTPMPISYELPMASAQVKSAVMLAALNVAGETEIIEPTPTRAHTENMLTYLGVPINITEDVTGKRVITIKGLQEFYAKDIEVPVDPSSAAFPIVAAIITPNSSVTVKNVLYAKERCGFLDCLVEMGASIEISKPRSLSGEYVVDIKARTSKLRGVNIASQKAASMIDEYPIISVAASVAEGESRFYGLDELRVKESDRLSAIVTSLQKCGVTAREEGNDIIISPKQDAEGFFIQGCDEKGVKAFIETHGDHRIAMSFLVAGMVARNTITVNKADMINTSFPYFVEIMNEAGANIVTA